MDTIESLCLFGLTRQEAGLYLVLTAENELTGYEAARQAGISRSNAYAALASLVDKGAAFRIDSLTPRYTAVAISEFCANRLRLMREAAEHLATSLPARMDPLQGYLTIEGRTNILNRLHTMVEQARERIYLALPADTLELIGEGLRAAVARGIKVVVISDRAVQLAGANSHCHPLPPEQVRLIADSSEVITGELGIGPQASCLYSRRKQLVDLFKDALRNEITLIEMTKAAPAKESE